MAKAFGKYMKSNTTLLNNKVIENHHTYHLGTAVTVSILWLVCQDMANLSNSKKIVCLLVCFLRYSIFYYLLTSYLKKEKKKKRESLQKAYIISIQYPFTYKNTYNINVISIYI